MNTNVLGIHGAPYTEWDGAKGSGQRGYCTHKTNLFATWHRPYLAAFEQVMHEWAVKIASEFPEGETREMYSKIADELRLPYWDWAIDPPDPEEGSMPNSLRRQMEKVTFPNGTEAEISNPLYQYVFHPMDREQFQIVCSIFVYVFQDSNSV